MRLLEIFAKVEGHLTASKIGGSSATLRSASEWKACCRYLLMGVAMVRDGYADRAQQLIGYVATKDADVAGAKDVLEAVASFPVR